MDRQLVALVDGNNFFVSCERLFRPDLAKRPVLVLSSNDGCVVARSQEVKDMGIPMAVPYFQIKDIIKDNDIAVFSSNFSLYRDLSRRLFSLVRQEVSVFEQYSIDEGFFTLPETMAQERCECLRQKIIGELGLPVSVGIALSKTLAKLAAKRAKKEGGVCLISRADWEVMSPGVGLGELWGVGSRRALAFRNAGLFTAQDVRAVTLQWITSRFGVEGARLWSELQGEMAYPVVPGRRLQQSIMHSRSFGSGVGGIGGVMQAVFWHVQRGVDDLNKLGVGTTKMSIFLGTSRTLGGGIVRKDMILDQPTNDPMHLLPLAKRAVLELHEDGVLYKRAGVTLGNLVPNKARPISLFREGVTEERNRNVGEVIQSLHSRMGGEVLQIGLVRGKQVWRTRQQRLSPAYTTDWSQLRTVSCR